MPKAKKPLAKIFDLADIEGMKYLFLLALTLFVMPVCGQEVKSDDAKPVNFTTQNWSKLGPATEGAKGFTLHGKNIRENSSGQYELWIKVVPIDAEVFAKHYSLPKATAFILQYAIVDCPKKMLSFEKTALYDARNSILEGSFARILPASKKDSVRPGSIGESVYKYVCVDPTTLPKN